MIAKCCRSTPRCAGCPVLLAAAARRDCKVSPTAALVGEILGGRRVTPLPPGVASALAQLDAARAARAAPAPHLVHAASD